MNRHEIDDTVLKFIISKFNKPFDNTNSFSYIYTDKNTRIEISKGSVMRLNEKITIHFYDIFQQNDVMDLVTNDIVAHTLSLNNSNVLRNFFENKEDELNVDYIRNNSEKLLKLIDKVL